MIDPLQRRAGAWSRVFAGADDAMALMALRDLGVFEALLDGPAAAPILAARLGAAPRRLRAFLDVAVSMGFLARSEAPGEPPAFALLPADAALFSEPGAASMIPSEDVPTFFGRRARALEVLRSDRGLDVASSGGDVSVEARTRFLTYLDRHALAEASEVASMLDGSDVAQVLDLGCGAGTYTLALLSRWPSARACLVDRPNARALVEGRLADAGMADRGAFVGADLLEEAWLAEVPPADVVVISNMLHNIGPEACATLVRRAARRLKPGGRLVLKDFLVHHDRTGPPGALRFALAMALCSAGGDLYSPREVAGWAAEAGLSPDPAETLMTAPESFVVVAHAPRT